MHWKIEVVPVPVTDIERAKRFYAERLGFAVDLDTPFGEGGRLVQLTPPRRHPPVLTGSARHLSGCRAADECA